MRPMFKQKVGMTKIYAKGIAELFLIRCNPYHWDGSGEVPDNISFDVYKRKIDETYDGCTLEIQLCKPDGCLCYAASVHLYEGGFWTGHGIGCFDKTAICNDPGSVDALTSAIMRVCMTYENLTNFCKVFVKCLTISQKRMNEIKQYTDDGKEQDEIEFESALGGQANLPLMAAVLSSVMKPTTPLQLLQVANDTTVTLVRATTLALATLSESC